MMLVFLNSIPVLASGGIKLFDIVDSVSSKESVVPGDTWDYSFQIKNKTDDTIRVRVSKLENLDNSELYDVFLMSVNNSSFVPCRDIKSDWIDVKKGDTFTYNIETTFPPVGNEYQGKEFHARLHFECEAPENSKYVGNGEVVKTGDTSILNQELIWMLISGGTVLFIGYKKNKREMF